MGNGGAVIMNFGEMIQERLRELNLDMKQGAARCKVKYIAFYYIAKGHREPGVSLATRICVGLDIPLDALKTLDEVTDPKKSSRTKGRKKKGK